MRRQLARAFGLLLGYLGCALGIRLVDVLVAAVDERQEPAAAAA